MELNTRQGIDSQREAVRTTDRIYKRKRYWYSLNYGLRLAFNLRAEKGCIFLFYSLLLRFVIEKQENISEK